MALSLTQLYAIDFVLTFKKVQLTAWYKSDGYEFSPKFYLLDDKNQVTFWQEDDIRYPGKKRIFEKVPPIFAGVLESLNDFAQAYPKLTEDQAVLEFIRTRIVMNDTWHDMKSIPFSAWDKWEVTRTAFHVTQKDGRVFQLQKVPEGEFELIGFSQN